MTAWVAGVLLLTAVVVFLVVYQDTGSQLEGEIDRWLTGRSGEDIAEGLRATGT